MISFYRHSTPNRACTLLALNFHPLPDDARVAGSVDGATDWGGAVGVISSTYLGLDVISGRSVFFILRCNHKGGSMRRECCILGLHFFWLGGRAKIIGSHGDLTERLVV